MVLYAGAVKFTEAGGERRETGRGMEDGVRGAAASLRNTEHKQGVAGAIYITLTSLSPIPRC